MLKFDLRNQHAGFFIKLKYILRTKLVINAGPTKDRGVPMTQKPQKLSYLFAILSVPLVLHFHLLPAVVAGMAVHVLTVKLARRVPAHWSGMAQ